MKKLLVACEESQRVCIEFRKRGWEAYSCDLISNGGGQPQWHIKQDVVPLLNGNCEFTTEDGVKHKIEGKWDMIIAHPPCTYLTNTGNPYFNISKYGNKALERIGKRKEAFDFFMKFYPHCSAIAFAIPSNVRLLNFLHKSELQDIVFPFLSYIVSQAYDLQLLGFCLIVGIKGSTPLIHKQVALVYGCSNCHG